MSSGMSTYEDFMKDILIDLKKRLDHQEVKLNTLIHFLHEKGDFIGYLKIPYLQKSDESKPDQET